MDPLTAAILLVFGVIAGIVGGFLGIGGCVIMLPALYFIFGYPLPMAIGTTITAVIVTAVSGALGHIRIGNVDYNTAKLVAFSGALGAIIGSIIFYYIASNVKALSMVLGAAFIYVALRMIYEGAVRRRPEIRSGTQIPGSGTSKTLLGFFIGVLTGIIGLGGGYALVPSFIYIFEAPIKISVGTSLASFISMALISGSIKVYTGHADVIAAVFLGVGTALGAQIGARLVPRVPGWAIKLIFGVVFLYVSVRFILSGLGIVI